jgi:hypothetical protein
VDIRQVHFAGQAGFRHAGHADNIGTIPLQPEDFRCGFQPRALVQA